MKDGQAGREGERERVGCEQSDGPAACYSTGPGSPLQSGWRPETEGTERLLSSNNTGKKKKQKPAPISFQTRREKRDPTLWRMRAFSNDKAHSWQILPPSERRGDTDPEKEKEKVGGVWEGEREVRTE